MAALKHNFDDSMDLDRSFFSAVSDTINEGIRNGEFRKDIDALSVTSMLRYAVGGLHLRWAINDKYVDPVAGANEIADLIISLLQPPQIDIE